MRPLDALAMLPDLREAWAALDPEDAGSALDASMRAFEEAAGEWWQHEHRLRIGYRQAGPLAAETFRELRLWSRHESRARARSAFGPNLDPGGFIGGLVDYHATAEADLWAQVRDVLRATMPDAAIGRDLDRLAQDYGVARMGDFGGGMHPETDEQLRSRVADVEVTSVRREPGRVVVDVRSTMRGVVDVVTIGGVVEV